MRVNDTIVVCTPAQLREAAIVLSCFLNDRFTPMIVLEPMPCTEADYRDLHEAYRQVRNQRDAAIGGEFGRLQAMGGKTQVIANEEVDAAAERLTPYRSWWKHLLLVGDLLDKLELRRAIFLFEPRPEELTPIQAVPMAAIGDERVSFFPESLERTYLLPAQTGAAAANRFTYRTLNELAEAAWRTVGRGVFPADAVLVPEMATAHYVAGLCRALRAGVPLKPVDQPAADLKAECAAANAKIAAPTEAVLVETADDATCLLGAQYAHARGAKLVLSPHLDPTRVDPARLAMEDCQQQAAKSFAYVSAHRDRGLTVRGLTETEQAFLKGMAAAPDAAEPAFEQAKFLGALRRAWRLLTDEAAAAIRGIERAVSALVPDDVVEAVGGLGLTVFTSGVPYNFVKKNGADWSNKSIGHITGDPLLLILTELCLHQPNDAVAFNLLFDPGYFQTTETHDVLSELSQRVSYSLTLHGNAASHQALGHLGSTLPVEVVFFNTHGGDQVLALSDLVMPAYKIVQRTQLPSRPIVFNNSCLSWVGVGREFIRIGARAYIGTLWSVGASMAAPYARMVLRRVIRENQPICQAMRLTGVDARTERAYVFIGTCQARLAAAKPGHPDHLRARLIEAADQLLQSAIVFFQYTEASNQVHHTAIQDLLIEEAEKLGVEIDRRWPEPSLERLDQQLIYLQALVHLAPRRPQDVLGKLPALERVAKWLEDLPLDPRTRAGRRAHWLDLLGRLSFQLGQTEYAVDQLRESVREAEKAGIAAGPQYLMLSDGLKKLGKLSEAQSAAQKALDAWAAKPGGPSFENERMLAIGRLASISNWLGHFDAAAAHARAGFELAARLSNPGEQSEFKADEARACIGLKDYDGVLRAAREAAYFARLAHQDHRELSGMGLIGQALLLKGDAAAAREIAEQGLALAQARRRPAHIAEFLRDLARIAAHEGKPVETFQALLPAVLLFAASGAVAKACSTLAEAIDLQSKINTWPSAVDLLQVEFEMFAAVDADVGRGLTVECVAQIKSAISRSTAAAAREPLQLLAQATAQALGKYQGQPPDHLRFVAEAVHMFANWARGETGAALTNAQRLDQLSSGSFQLAAFMKERC